MRNPDTRFPGSSSVVGSLLAICLLAATAGAQAEDPRPVVDDSRTPKAMPATNNLPTLWIVGDSTVNAGPNDKGMRGWGEVIAPYFDSSKINVVNRAIGGRSSKTFITEGRWDKVMAEMKAGDFVMVQFGHNDAGKFDAPGSKGRPSLPGEGDETAELTLPDGTKQTVHTFGWYMNKYVTDAKAKGGTVILCSMIPHKGWTPEGKVARGERNGLVKWTESAAARNGALYLDLNQIIALGYEKLGQPKVESFFADARTHTSATGALYNASAVIFGLRAMPANPLEKFLAADAPTDLVYTEAPSTQPSK